MKILVTGSTGFIGRSLTRHLVEAGHQVRVLLQPSLQTPSLPRGIPVEASVTSFADARGIRAALRGIQVVYHLASGEGEGGRADLEAIDIDGTHNLVDAARDANPKRIFYLSHLTASSASAFPVFKAKGMAEDMIRKSGIPYTILRGGLLFGPEDFFTRGLAMLLALSPGVMPLPGHGRTAAQPLWVEDLSTCFTRALTNPETLDKTIEVAGIESFTLQQLMEILMTATGLKRLLFSSANPPMRLFTATLESLFPRFPATVFWLDYFTVNRTCALDSVPRQFGFNPARFTSRLGYLQGVRWGWEAWKRLLTRRG